MGIIDKYDILMFDLDGTLTDSGPGIVKSFEYTINTITDIIVKILLFFIYYSFVLPCKKYY